MTDIDYVARLRTFLEFYGPDDEIVGYTHDREAVSACSAALAQVRRAIRHAEQVYATEEAP